MKIERVPGTNKKHKVFLYALSTCAWCKKTKRLLQDKGVEFEFVDVDLCSEEDLKRVRADITRRGAGMTFPLVIVDDKTLVVGFREDKIEEALAG
ncbi:MAG: glutaredoxin family protein [Candidatus Verstraetearchaeota archaeon]|nr:glutaredoxin family protein [Candidatus Verstraetearchaeota archaeon]